MRAIGPCLTSLFALTACLGGGGGGGASSPGFSPVNLPLSADPASFETGEYRRSGGLEPVNASTLYAAGGTGLGVTVALIDTGLDPDQADFAGALHPASVDLVRNVPLTDVSGHGTAVAGLLGARRNGTGIHGMAFDSTLLMIRADAPGSCSTACAFEQADLAEATDYAVVHGARVVNFSLGDAPALSGSLRQALGSAADAGQVLVFAAGNDSRSAPQQPALFASSGTARGQGIIVGSVDQNMILSDFSNRAGSAADVFIVAPGEGLRSTALGSGTTTITGTSAATPLVAGAAAALLSAAPHLSAANVVAILLQSAADLGAPGTDPVYGRGLLDLERALAPVGPLRLPEGVSTSADARPLRSTRLALGTAFGGAAVDFGPVMALDTFDRAYAVSLPTRATRRSSSALPDLLRRQQVDRPEALALGDLTLELARYGLGDQQTLLAASDLTGLGLSWQVDEAWRMAASLGEPVGPRDPAAIGFWQQRRGGDETASLVDLAAPASVELDAALNQAWRVSLTLAGDPDGTLAQLATRRHDWRSADALPVEPQRGRLAALGLTRTAGERASWRLGMGVLEEAEGPLGSTGDGGLRAGNAVTPFIDIAAQLRLTPGVRAFGRTALGRTETTSKGGMLTALDPLWSTSFELGMTIDEVARAGDRLTFTLSQPLRVEAGEAHLDVPVARDLAGRVVRAERTADLRPDGREIDLELSYGTTPGGRAGRLQTAVMLRLDPDHDADASPELLLGLTYRLRF